MKDKKEYLAPIIEKIELEDIIPFIIEHQSGVTLHDLQ